MEKENKNTSRANQSRSKSERPKVWVPPSSLDAPPAPDGFRYRWIRAEVVGFQDTKNITGRLREGYELVRAEEVENAGDYPILEEGKYKGESELVAFYLRRYRLRSRSRDKTTWQIVMQNEAKP